MNLLPMKGHYFLYNAGTGLVIPYLPVLAKELGFSSVVVGMVYTLLPILAMVAKPTMGALADRLHWQKGMFMTFILLTMLSLFVIPWIPPLPSQTGVEIHCDGNSVVKMCSDNLANSKCSSDFAKKIGNSTVHCNMVCEANSSFLESVCDTWKQPQYCAALRSSNNHFLAAVKKNLSIDDHKRTSAKPKFLASGPQTLRFIADLIPQHTEQVEKCLFIRLGEVYFNTSEKIIPYCNTFKAVNCSMECDNEYITGLTKNPQIDNSKAVTLYQFWLFCFSLIFGWVSMAVVVSISDAICFELLGEFPSKYGNQRLWGSIGWGLLSFLGGFIIDQFSAGQVSKNHTPVFILMVITLSINLIVAWKLKYKQVKTSASILRDVGRLLSEGRVLIFMLWCICIGMCTAMVWNFLFWYLEELADCDTKERIKTLEGSVMIIQCFGGELPFFFLSGWVLKKIGHIHSMSLVLISFGIRFLLYSVLTDPWWVLPIEFLNGVTFGMAYASMASYASIVAPPGTEATTQGLVGAVFEGLGVSAGSFVGGLLMNQMKGSAVFRLFGIAALVAAVIHAVGQYFLSKRTAVLNIHEKG